MFSSAKKNFFKYLVLFVITILIASILITVFFMHYHILPNGRMIYHSHALPIHSPSKSAHKHTQLEYLNYFLITVFNYFLIQILSIRCKTKLLIFIRNLFKAFDLQEKFFFQYLRRAPPSLNI